jgi:hypothetical protein
MGSLLPIARDGAFLARQIQVPTLDRPEEPSTGHPLWYPEAFIYIAIAVETSHDQDSRRDTPIVAWVPGNYIENAAGAIGPSLRG